MPTGLTQTEIKMVNQIACLVLEDEKQGHATQARAVAEAFVSLKNELSGEYEFKTQSVLGLVPEGRVGR